MMFSRPINRLLLKSLPIVTIMLAMVACSGGGGGGSSTLSWTPPSERTDGSALALTEIAGYRVYYGTVKGDYTNSILIDDGSLDESELDAIPSGDYFVVVTTIDTDGRESIYSKEVKINL